MNYTTLALAQHFVSQAEQRLNAKNAALLKRLLNAVADEEVWWE